MSFDTRSRSMDVSAILPSIKDFILDQFLAGEDPNALTDHVELISSQVLDSIGVLKLVAFLENRFGITFAPHEVGVDYLNTLDSIRMLVVSKMAQASRDLGGA